MSPALRRPHSDLERIMREKEKTSSNDQEDYDESENLCR